MLRIREQFLGLEIRYERSGVLVTVLFRAQPQHAICESYPTDTAKDHQSSNDAKRPPEVRMATDEDSRDAEADPQRHAQGAIHPPHIQKRCHIASAVRRVIQDWCNCLSSSAFYLAEATRTSEVTPQLVTLVWWLGFHAPDGR